MFKPTEVELTFQGRVATITLHSEKQVNALSSPTADALLRAGEAVMRHRSVGVVVLTGAGDKAFIAGKDLNENAGEGYRDEVTALHSITKTHMVCHLFRALPVPSIARINGYCLGAGMEVAACCDLRVGADHSRYGMPEVRIGSISHMEANVFPRLMGWGATRELLYRGTMIDAAEAHRLGFLNRVAPLADLDAAMQPIIADILAAEPNAIRAQKRLIESWLSDTGLEAGVQRGLDAKIALQRLGHTVNWSQRYFAGLREKKKAPAVRGGKATAPEARRNPNQKKWHPTIR